MQRERKKKQKAEAKRKQRLERKAGNAAPTDGNQGSKELIQNSPVNFDASDKTEQATQDDAAEHE